MKEEINDLDLVWCEFEKFDTEEYVQIRRCEIIKIREVLNNPDRTELTLRNGDVIAVRMKYRQVCEMVIV